jgi:hypothetical protein
MQSPDEANTQHEQHEQYEQEGEGEEEEEEDLPALQLSRAFCCCCCRADDDVYAVSGGHHQPQHTEEERPLGETLRRTGRLVRDLCAFGLLCSACVVLNTWIFVEAAAPIDERFGLDGYHPHDHSLDASLLFFGWVQIVDMIGSWLMWTWGTAVAVGLGHLCTFGWGEPSSPTWGEWVRARWYALSTVGSLLFTWLMVVANLALYRMAPGSAVSVLVHLVTALVNVPLTARLLSTELGSWRVICGIMELGIFSGIVYSDAVFPLFEGIPRGMARTLFVSGGVPAIAMVLHMATRFLLLKLKLPAPTTNRFGEVRARGLWPLAVVLLATSFGASKVLVFGLSQEQNWGASAALATLQSVSRLTMGCRDHWFRRCFKRASCERWLAISYGDESILHADLAIAEMLVKVGMIPLVASWVVAAQVGTLHRSLGEVLPTVLENAAIQLGLELMSTFVSVVLETQVLRLPILSRWERSGLHYVAVVQPVLLVGQNIMGQRALPVLARAFA